MSGIALYTYFGFRAPQLTPMAFTLQAIHASWTVYVMAIMTSPVPYRAI